MDELKYDWCKRKNIVLSGLKYTNFMFGFSTHKYKPITLFILKKSY